MPWRDRHIRVILFWVLTEVKKAYFAIEEREYPSVLVAINEHKT
jgi:hypothetical protein